MCLSERLPGWPGPLVCDVSWKVIRNDYMELSLFSMAIRSNDPIVAKIVARQRTNSLPLLTLAAKEHRSPAAVPFP